MAVPKQKSSRTRGRKRRTHYKTSAPTVTECPDCGEPRLPHTACPECGTYKGRQVIAPPDEEED